jgi:hypothetical protein
MPRRPVNSARIASRTERRRGFSLRQQLKVLTPLIGVWAIGFSILVGVAVRGRPGELLLDPVYASGGSWYFGAVAQFGVLAWSVAAVLAGAASWLVGRLGRTSARPFLLTAAFAGTVLLFDDLFALHATVIGRVVPKTFGMMLVVAPILWWAINYRSDIMRTRWQVLLCAAAGLATSAIVDVGFAQGQDDYLVLIEDGAKFLGVLAWATYMVVTVRDIAESAMSDRRSFGPTGSIELSADHAKPRTRADHEASTDAQIDATPAANASTSSADVSQLHTQRT